MAAWQLAGHDTRYRFAYGFEFKHGCWWWLPKEGVKVERNQRELRYAENFE